MSMNFFHQKFTKQNDEKSSMRPASLSRVKSEAVACV